MKQRCRLKSALGRKQTIAAGGKSDSGLSKTRQGTIVRCRPEADVQIAMNRDAILRDQAFWQRLEYAASRLLSSSNEKALRQFWVDGFLPEALDNTKAGANISGGVWLGEGSRRQKLFRFVASVPQRMLHRRRATFVIEEIAFDEGRGVLHLSLAPKSG